MCISKAIRCLVIAKEENFLDTAYKLLHSYNKKDNSLEYASSVSLGIKKLEAEEFDLILLDNQSMDDLDINLLINKEDLAESVIVITPNRVYDEIFRKTYHKGFLVLPRPVTVNTFMQACEIGLHSTEKRRMDLNNPKRLHEIAFQDVAKLLLVLHERMDEMNAHRYVEKLSMDLRVAKQKSAEYVIGRYIKS